MQTSRSRAPVLLKTAIALTQEFASCSNGTRGMMSGDILKFSASYQHRLVSSALAAQSALPLLAQLATPNHTQVIQGLRQYAAAAAANPEPKQPKEQVIDTLELTQEKINAITDKIPQQPPVGVVEGTSYTLIIIAAFGVLAFVLYQVLTSLIFEPTALTCFNHTLDRLRTDPRITVRIGAANDIVAWGTNSESRVARQQIPHQIYKDFNGVEHVRIQFHIRGPSGQGTVNADMYKDALGEWQYTYLIVDTVPASAGSGSSSTQRLTIVGGR